MTHMLRGLMTVFCLAGVLLLSVASVAEPLDAALAEKGDDGAQWFNLRDIGVQGQGWEDTAQPYDRMPARAEGVATDAVWNLAKHSAGMFAHFRTDSPSIAARWRLRNENLAMNHMAATGVSGLDLYAKADDGVWRWVGIGRPTAFPDNEATLVSGIPDGMHEFLLYLPLYNGVESVSVGIAADAVLEPVAAETKPFVVYGTSIVHGGCASRTGMAYPSILSRRLGVPAINLGFSGNGRMEIEMADFLGELDVALYVIDCAPNMAPELIAERVVPFVKRLREIRPDTPILLVENIEYQQGWLIPASREAYQNKNTEWKKAYDALVADGVANLHYFPGHNLLGDDTLGTVDGTHPTDLGFLRMADALEPAIRELLP